jgi:hypothetical protein
MVCWLNSRGGGGGVARLDVTDPSHGDATQAVNEIVWIDSKLDFSRSRDG